MWNDIERGLSARPGAGPGCLCGATRLLDGHGSLDPMDGSPSGVRRRRSAVFQALGRGVMVLRAPFSTARAHEVPYRPDSELFWPPARPSRHDASGRRESPLHPLRARARRRGELWAGPLDRRRLERSERRDVPSGGAGFPAPDSCAPGIASISARTHPALDRMVWRRSRRPASAVRAKAPVPGSDRPGRSSTSSACGRLARDRQLRAAAALSVEGHVPARVGAARAGSGRCRRRWRRCSAGGGSGPATGRSWVRTERVRPPLRGERRSSRPATRCSWTRAPSSLSTRGHHTHLPCDGAFALAAGCTTWSSRRGAPRWPRCAG